MNALHSDPSHTDALHINVRQSDELRINASRLLQFISDMAQIGATANGGCNRQALTEGRKSEGRGGRVVMGLSWINLDSAKT